ncbi:hypothetical protein [Lacticaseibacillus brantae]|uniref:GyrI-like small molecule binding domain-containing protein n=1 Tax=Lacticaseibacillus brantae DSM 23927 TaxID=1423727 RepID=A0A0R2AYC4_9LACO|nr:hypothetical protein [Lacticaseibacillus brantae]KRM71754.1 hypothetical protein FC34_GL001413 [Lacticaseibacillus brantae DSM 23927]
MAFLFDWSEMETDEYTTDTQNGSVVQLGERNYIMLSGSGDEQSDQFMQDAAAMLTLGQFMTEAPDHGIEIEGFRNYNHYPLNVSWHGDFTSPHKDYEMLMKHPNFMPKAAVDAAIEQLGATNPIIKKIHYGRFEEGLEAQIGHVGLINQATIDMLKHFIESTPFEIDTTDTAHRELYLNDITKAPRDQWQTILRQRVVGKGSAGDRYPIIFN